MYSAIFLFIEQKKYLKMEHEIKIIQDIFFAQRGYMLYKVKNQSKLINEERNVHVFLTEKLNCYFADFLALINSVKTKNPKIIFFTRNLVFTKPLEQKLNEVSKDWEHLHYPVINIFEHFLVPKYSILPKEKEMKNKNKLPKMTTTDPIAKWLGVKKGQVLLIEFPDYFEYRIVDQINLSESNSLSLFL